MTLSTTAKTRIVCLSVLLILTLLLYGDIFLLPKHLVYSRPDGDFAMGYYNLQFTISQIKQGIFPLWCPQMMGGYPYFAGLQTEIFYPFAVLFLGFPMNVATNLYFILHIFLIGAGTLLWLLNRKVNPFGAILSATIIMFSSYVTMRLNMGQGSPLAVLTWFPWLLLTIDSLFQRNNAFRDTLLIVLFACLEIAAGFPQHTIYAFVAITFYTLFFAITDRSHSWKFRAGICLIILGSYLFAALLNAIQLLTTLDAMSETARKIALPLYYRNQLSLTPSSLITLLSPNFFGNGSNTPYWGTWISCYSINFLGLTSLVLAFYGAISAKDKLRWIAPIIIIPFFMYALGNHSFVFEWVAKLPLFSKMRVPFRAVFYVDFFISALAGLGVHEFLKESPSKKLKYALLFNLLLIFIGIIVYGFVTYYSLPENIRIWQDWIIHASQPFNTKYLQNHPLFAFTIAEKARSDLFFSLVILCSSAIIIVLTKKYNKARYILCALALFELLLFASTMKRGFPIAITYNQHLKHFLKTHRGDSRFIKIPNNNWAMSLSPQYSGGDINGYESFRLKRYEDFVNFNQGDEINSVQTFLQVTRYRPLYRLLRCKYVFIVKGDKKGGIAYKIVEKSGALPHLLLVDHWKVLSGAKNILTTMKSPAFVAEKNVVLENQPHFYPADGKSPAKNDAQLIRSSSQWLDIKATTDKKSILLVTDAYAKGWKVFPYPDSAQQNYDVMPADYILRGIPLSPGTHHFRLEYAPDAFYRGKNISLAALALYLLAWCGLFGIEWRKKYTNGKNNK